MKTHWIKGAITLTALAGLFWLLSRIGWETILLHLRQVGVTGFGLLCLAGLVEVCMDGIALRKAVSNRVSFLTVLLINQEGAAVNMLMPGEAGEVLKASLLSKHMPSREATSSVVVWNMAFRLSKSIVILLAAGLSFALFPSHHEATSWSVGLAVFNLGLYFVLNIALKRRWVGRVLSALAGRHFKRFVDHARDAESKAAEFSGSRSGDYASIVALQAGARMANFATLWLALTLLNAGYAFPLCLLIYALTELSSYVVSLLPTRMGTTEGSTYLLFEFLKLGGPFGAILQVVLRVKQLTLTSCFLTAALLARVFPASPPLLEKKPDAAGVSGVY